MPSTDDDFSLFWTFSADQKAELRNRLATVVPTPRLDEAISSLETVCGWAVADRSTGTSRLREMAEAEESHFTKMRRCAEALRELLAIRRPIAKMYDFNWDGTADFSGRRFDGIGFDPMLDLLIESADIHAKRANPNRRRRGRAPEEWRDRLIRWAFSVYPPGYATKTMDGHFEETVRMLLAYVGAEVSDVHSVVIDALRREADSDSPAKK